jgi:murein L,D-transpeptidase YcbB/YkuD
VDPKLFATAHDVDIDVVVLTKQALEAPDLLAFLKAQPPQHRYYSALIPALARYRKIQQNGGWSSIPAGNTLEVGANDPRVSTMRKRLSITGEYAGAVPGSTIYDEELEQAVKLFQEHHFLTPDGKAGKGTIAAINVSAEDRVRQIIINLERWRWTSRDMEGTQIFVNIAGYHLAGLTDEVIDIRMPVIVGKEYHMTPVFSDSIKYLEFNPYWNVPTSITINEYLPQLQKNPNALSAKDIRIFSKDKIEIDPNSVDWKNVSKKEMTSYRLRQDPGPKNALGTVKFIFPNPYSVYLHDTPNHAPFAQQDRAMSHGCIRLSQPHELAAYVLGSEDDSWTLERVKQVVDAKERKVVHLNKPMPVHILYRTVVATPDGVVRFGDDVYGRDRLLAKALFGS